MSDQTKPPVKVSGEAHRYLSERLREWSGWKDATLTLDKPPSNVSPWAMTHMTQRRFWINPHELSLNPHRVLNTITPFRLRQEAVLTGAMLHEAAHARFSTWQPRDEETFKRVMVHADGRAVTEAEWALCTLMEEARIEFRLEQEAARVKASGLTWTVHAMAMHLFTPTEASTDPNQQVMDLIQNWATSAARRKAARYGTPTAASIKPLPLWVTRFDDLLRDQITQHLHKAGAAWHSDGARRVLDLLTHMSMLDETNIHPMTIPELAREVLEILYPAAYDGSGGEAVVAAVACFSDHSEEDSEEDGEGSGESDESDSEDGDGDGDGDGDEEGEGSGPTEAEQQAADDLNERLSKIMASAKATTEAESHTESKKMGDTPSTGAGAGDPSKFPTIKTFRAPTPSDRSLARGAETFLRDLINPTESSNTTLSDAPSAMIDGPALSAWKAGGRTRNPRFFVRTQRTVTPAPPVKVAILVDVSMSMNMLAAPSALLSWALSTAAVDLRNFAGRGTQVESTLIHWGDGARVIQPNGDALPGIGEHGCYEGTTAMHSACELVEQQIPGFFDPAESGKESHRLLVQFTDWGLSGHGMSMAAPWMWRAYEAGVTMLTVAPYQWHNREMYGYATSVPAEYRDQSAVMYYRPGQDHLVWDEAKKTMRG